MVINSLIMQNKQLASKLRAYQSEIEKVMQLRDMIRSEPLSKRSYERRISNLLKKKIETAVNTFEYICDMYDICEPNNSSNLTINLISTSEYGIIEMQSVFDKLKNSRKKNQISEYCKQIEADDRR